MTLRLLMGLLSKVLLLKGLLSLVSCACPSFPLHLLVACRSAFHLRDHCRAKSRRILHWTAVLQVLLAPLLALKVLAMASTHQPHLEDQVGESVLVLVVVLRAWASLAPTMGIHALVLLLPLRIWAWACRVNCGFVRFLAWPG